MEWAERVRPTEWAGRVPQDEQAVRVPQVGWHLVGVFGADLSSGLSQEW